MGLSEILEKSNPVQAKRQKENASAFKSLANRNTELVDENKELKEENKRLNNIINELEEYLKSFLYMLNGILDRDIYEQCQLDDFTQIMDKLQELKDSDKEC